MKQETKETVEQKIKDLRAAMQADKSEKMKPKRKASGAPAQDADLEMDKKAGGQHKVRFWEVPEEFEAVDYTKQEDVRELTRAAEEIFGVPVPHQDRPRDGGDARAPKEAKELLAQAKRLESGPVLGALGEASDDLYAWAAT